MNPKIEVTIEPVKVVQHRILFKTTDGNHFYRENDAENHQKILDNPRDFIAVYSPHNGSTYYYFKERSNLDNFLLHHFYPKDRIDELMTKCWCRISDSGSDYGPDAHTFDANDIDVAITDLQEQVEWWKGMKQTLKDLE